MKFKTGDLLTRRGYDLNYYYIVIGYNGSGMVIVKRHNEEDDLKHELFLENQLRKI
jgi:uncharacterized protein YodC (DUF2158 family)